MISDPLVSTPSDTSVLHVSVWHHFLWWIFQTCPLSHVSVKKWNKVESKTWNKRSMARNLTGSDRKNVSSYCAPPYIHCRHGPWNSKLFFTPSPTTFSKHTCCCFFFSSSSFDLQEDMRSENCLLLTSRSSWTFSTSICFLRRSVDCTVLRPVSSSLLAV